MYLLYIKTTRVDWLTQLGRLRSPKHLPSASWKCRRAGGVAQSKSEDLRTRRVSGVSPSPRAGVQCPSSTVRQRECKFFPSQHFCSMHALSGLDESRPY